MLERAGPFLKLIANVKAYFEDLTKPCEVYSSRCDSGMNALCLKLIDIDSRIV